MWLRFFKVSGECLLWAQPPFTPLQTQRRDQVGHWRDAPFLIFSHEYSKILAWLSRGKMLSRGRTERWGTTEYNEAGWPLRQVHVMTYGYTLLPWTAKSCQQMPSACTFCSLGINAVSMPVYPPRVGHSFRIKSEFSTHVGRGRGKDLSHDWSHSIPTGPS